MTDPALEVCVRGGMEALFVASVYLIYMDKVLVRLVVSSAK